MGWRIWILMLVCVSCHICLPETVVSEVLKIESNYHTLLVSTRVAMRLP